MHPHTLISGALGLVNFDPAPFEPLTRGRSDNAEKDLSLGLTTDLGRALVRVSGVTSARTWLTELGYTSDVVDLCHKLVDLDAATTVELHARRGSSDRVLRVLRDEPMREGRMHALVEGAAGEAYARAMSRSLGLLAAHDDGRVLGLEILGAEGPVKLLVAAGFRVPIAEREGFVEQVDVLMRSRQISDRQRSWLKSQVAYLFTRNVQIPRVGFVVHPQGIIPQVEVSVYREPIGQLSRAASTWTLDEDFAATMKGVGRAMGGDGVSTFKFRAVLGHQDPPSLEWHFHAVPATITGPTVGTD